MELNQVTLPSTDVARSVEFYRRMGFRLIVEDLPGYARFECAGGATFSVHLQAAPPADPGVVVYFECATLDVTVAELKRRGMRIEAEPCDQPWLWREAYLRDPDGNRICLYYAGENRRHPPWRLQ
jgi:catechol 2,3-dioxygenase-like lactoylglutathione lyase family enzyme